MSWQGIEPAWASLVGGEHSSKELFKNSLVMAIQNIYMTITSFQSKVGLTLYS